MKCGIVGLPNVGKSTLFNALSGSKAEAANYPFCTIEPNQSVVEVPDQRLDLLTQWVKPKKTIPAFVEFVDIAGLVKGASKGEGLGNKFLSHIKDCQAVCHVVRCFEDENVVHVEGSIDPLRDISVIESELLIADLMLIEKRLQAAVKLAKSNQKEAINKRDLLQAMNDHLEAGKPIRELELYKEKKNILTDIQLITDKPMLYMANLSEDDYLNGSYQQNPHYLKVVEHAQKNGAQLIALAAKTEADLSGMEAEEKSAFLQEMGVKEPGLHKFIRTAYELLGLQTYFTAGEKEVRAWTIHKGWTAPQAAGVIHSDFERGFIAAQIYHFRDLQEHQSEAKIKEAGLMRTEGKEYSVQDGDVILFRFNV